jgi:hypothetical protein
MTLGLQLLEFFLMDFLKIFKNWRPKNVWENAVKDNM